MTKRAVGEYDPWRDAHERYPHIHIEWRPIAPAHAALVRCVDVILVDEDISRAERRCALAHELAHLDAGDAPTAQCFYGARQETSADKLAARRLIDVRQFAAVLRWTDDYREVAEELNVTLNVLAIRRRWLHPVELSFVRDALRRREAVA